MKKDRGFGTGTYGGGNQKVKTDKKRQETGGEERRRIRPKPGPHA